MRYADFSSREQVLERKLDELVLLIVESNKVDVDKIVDYANRNNVSTSEANKMLLNKAKKFLSAGGSVSKITSLTKKVFNVIKDPKISLLIIATALASVNVHAGDKDADNMQLDMLVNSIMQDAPQQKVQTKAIDKKSQTKQVKQNKSAEVTQSSTESGATEYTLQAGDSVWKIANKNAPKNVEPSEYSKVLKKINSKSRWRVGDTIKLPTGSQLTDITLPEITDRIDINSSALVGNIKYAEGDETYQANNTRTLLNGKRGYPFKNGKFYPYKDSKGFWTIGYGHLIHKTDKAAAMKYRNGITPAQAESMMKKDMVNIKAGVVRYMQKNNITNAPKNVQEALFELGYIMGVNKLYKFTSMTSNIRMGNYSKAADDVAGSLWAKQVGSDRANRVVSHMKG